MSYLLEKTAYLKGLADGMKIDSRKDEGKLVMAIIDVLEDFAEEMDLMGEEIVELDDVVADMEDIVSDVEESITSLEDEVYGEFDMDDEYIGDIECPNCGEDIYIDSYMILNDEIICDNCDKHIDIDEFLEDNKELVGMLEDEDVDTNCGCGCGCSDEK